MIEHTLILVLKRGGDFEPAHAIALHRAVQRYTSDKVRTLCLTDSKSVKLRREERLEVVPLKHGWPGWWSKLEMFRPDLPVSATGMIVYIDLDTVITGDLDDVFEVRPFTMLHGFRLDRWASGLMSWFPCAKNSPLPAVYERFLTNPTRQMQRFGHRGDQAFIEESLKKDSPLRPLYWQDQLPGQVVSYKNHVRPQGDVLGTRTRVVCFHGKPRPWTVQADWAVQQYASKVEATDD